MFIHASVVVRWKCDPSETTWRRWECLVYAVYKVCCLLEKAVNKVTTIEFKKCKQSGYKNEKRRAQYNGAVLGEASEAAHTGISPP